MNLPGDPPRGLPPSSQCDGHRGPRGYRGQLALDLGNLPPGVALPEQLHGGQQSSQLLLHGLNLELSVGTGGQGCQARGRGAL